MLGRADRAGVLDTPTCLAANRCPSAQRDRCRRTVPGQRPVPESDVERHLAKIGHPGLPYTLNTSTRTVVLHEPVPLRDRHNLAQVLTVTVRSPRRPRRTLLARPPVRRTTADHRHPPVKPPLPPVTSGAPICLPPPWTPPSCSGPAAAAPRSSATSCAN
ncbi:hypothetical protein ACU686_09850 [Yinghuangia aomiensis]